MASGIVHDFTGAIAAVAAVPISAILFGAENVLPFTAGAAAGFIWLSPDLDMAHSWPSKRWLIFHPLTHFYRKVHYRHRGASHWPVVGSGVRMLFLIALLMVLRVIAILVYQETGYRFLPIDPIDLVMAYGLMFWFGVEYASMNHVAFDLLANIIPALNDRGSWINRRLR